VQPLDGGTLARTGATLQLTPSAGSNRVLVTLEDTTTPHTWDIVLPGDTTAYILPALAEDGLVAGHSYRWRVTTYAAPGISFHDHEDDAFRTATTHVTRTAWRTFTVQ
jgi:hypothetical protein